MAALGCGLFAMLAGGLVPAQAAADATTTSQQPPPRVELVLDVSGSMSTPDIDGQSRMSAAKQAFDDVIDETPADVDLGIRTLGADYPGNNRQIGCKDTEQLYPVRQLSPAAREQAKALVASLQPTGWTPIGPALEAAAKDLAGGGDTTRRIVLITDGEDTCGPTDPCQVARDLAASDVGLTIDTIGLVPDASTRNQESCIAQATGGTYTTVQHRQQLTTRVQQLVKTSTDPSVNPVSVQGGSSCSTAPTLTPGLYSDHETFASNLWYKVAVNPGQELRAAATIADDRSVYPDYGVQLRAVTTSGQELVRDDEDGTGRTDAISAGVRWPRPPSHSDNPPPAQIICLEVGNSFSAPASVKTSPGLPVELSVTLRHSPDNPSDVAFFGLGRGWWLLGLLTVTGFVVGLLWGWLSRWRVAIWRTN